MGQSNQPVKKDVKGDIQFRLVTANNDKYFDDIENKCNYFKYIGFESLLMIFLNFRKGQIDENLNKYFNDYNGERCSNFSKRVIYEECLDETNFNLLLKSKIIKNLLVGNNADDNSLSYFNSFYSNYFSTASKLLKNFIKIISDSNFKYKGEEIPKICFLSFAFYYGNAPMKIKIESFFNLLCNENSMIHSQDIRLKTIVFFLISAGSGISLITLNEFAQSDSKVRDKFHEDEFIRIYDMYQVKDSIRSLNNFIKTVFELSDYNDCKEINFEVFNFNFKRYGFYWLFYPSGTRNYLESNTD